MYGLMGTLAGFFLPFNARDNVLQGTRSTRRQAKDSLGSHHAD